eukprot:CAMPEP_0197049584 /NCGR_PEP_ID=MMETSP1384-20130603/24697_1 /TAXON_ID=29189 /ORGANISM="Ammonia sp." /LENGTH=344 /DNA_ID=CAMNT_0042481879 /DNA_START=42 /DNA_END=1076 /DNA_ORIENTATION=-
MAEVSKRANHSNIVKPLKSITKLSKSTALSKKKNKNKSNNNNNNNSKKTSANANANVNVNSSANANTNANMNTNANAAHFVSQCVLWQTNPRKVNYTIYVKIVIRPPNREPQEIRFPYQPDRESLESVIHELVDALQLDANLHHKLIVRAIQHAMKTKRMRIVRTSPIASHSQPPPPPPPHHNNANGNAQTKTMHASKNKGNASKPQKRKGSNVHQEMAGSANNLSPKKHGKCPLDFEEEEYLFSPLSPLVVSPRIIHRKSAAKFPNLRIASQSMSESDPLSLMKQIKYDEDLCYNSTSNSASNSRRNSQLIDDHYMEKILHHAHNLQVDEEDDDDDIAAVVNF